MGGDMERALCFLMYSALGNSDDDDDDDDGDEDDVHLWRRCARTTAFGYSPKHGTDRDQNRQTDKQAEHCVPELLFW
jgi:hypothetical protein